MTVGRAAAFPSAGLVGKAASRSARLDLNFLLFLLWLFRFGVFPLEPAANLHSPALVFGLTPYSGVGLAGAR